MHVPSWVAFRLFPSSSISLFPLSFLQLMLSRLAMQLKGLPTSAQENEWFPINDGLKQMIWGPTSCSPKETKTKKAEAKQATGKAKAIPFEKISKNRNLRSCYGFNQFHELFDSYAGVKQVMLSSLSLPGKSLCPEIGPSSIEIMLPSGAHLWQKPWVPGKGQAASTGWKIWKYEMHNMNVETLRNRSIPSNSWLGKWSNMTLD